MYSEEYIGVAYGNELQSAWKIIRVQIERPGHLKELKFCSGVLTRWQQQPLKII